MAIIMRLTSVGIAASVGLIAVYGYVIGTDAFSSWVNILIAQLVFAAAYLLVLALLRRGEGINSPS